MNFTSQIRYNPETGEYGKYYRLKEVRPQEMSRISSGLSPWMNPTFSRMRVQAQPLALR